MEPALSRTVSAESTQSWQQLTAASGSSPADRKARSSEPETGGDIVGRASVSLPPSGSQAMRQMPARRTSKASDSLFDFFGQARGTASSSIHNGSAIEETETTPTLEGTRASLAPVNALMLPEVCRPPRPDVDAAESKRLSFSSLYSIGSAIYANTRGHSWSGRSSIAGSEPEGTSRYAAPGNICMHT
jgi:inositol hexakisphosphate/diphosphoinositol-pentakisphosphate kinase